jgi:hypothetical protein
MKSNMTPPADNLRASRMTKTLLPFVIGATCIALLAGSASATPATPDHFDLIADQTGFRDQMNRGGCTMFGVTAALEAAYKRLGHGELNLSEEFLNHALKMFKLHPDHAITSPMQQECELGPTDGGDALENARSLTINQLKLPLDTAMPFHPQYTSFPAWPPWLETDMPFDIANWNDPWFSASQKNTDTINLNPGILRLPQLALSRFYGVGGFSVTTANDPDAIEAVLVSGKEVVVDVYMIGDTWLRTDHPEARLPAMPGAHSMLVVGYDRTDPSNRYFILKNSWAYGDPPVPGTPREIGWGGFQRVSYEFIRRAAYSALYITSVTPIVDYWQELQFLGRWNLDFDGWQGTLDIYHLPGMAKRELADAGVTNQDLRLGTFFDNDGNAFRVNGAVTDTEISFWIDSDHPNATYDQRNGRHFRYHMLREGDHNNEMAGFHFDPDGRQYAGYARKDLPFLSGVVSSGPIQVSTYFGAWNVNFDGIQGAMRIETRNDSGVPAGWAGLRGTITYSLGSMTYTKDVQLNVNVTSPWEISLIIPRGTSGIYSLSGKMLSWNPGVIAGEGKDPWFKYVGFYANRTGDIFVSPPAIQIINPPSVIVGSCMPTGAVANFTVTATNIITGAIVPVTCSPPSGSVFLPGMTTVYCWAGTNNVPNATTSFPVIVGLPPLTIQKAVTGNQVTLSWPCGMLQESDSLNGPWRDLQNVNNPYIITTQDAATRFYRTRR